LALVSPSLAQDESQKKAGEKAVEKQDTGKVPTSKEIEKTRKQEKEKANQPTFTPAEALAEWTIIAYGGRKALENARASIHEEGTIRLATEDGDLTGSYNLRSIRKEKSWLDLLRTDLDITPPDSVIRQGGPRSIKYVIAFNGATVWSAQNNQYTNPRPEVESAFRALLSHEYTTLLRYKEDGSKLELKDPETVTGIQANVVELTTPDGEKTKYWISAKTFRVLHAEYELKLNAGAKPIKYRVSYYYTPLRVVQNTLVPSRRVMTQDGKFVQEISLTNIIYSAKLNPEIFQHLQESGQ
jgi:hypothetical protein